uniref:Uncharacterized protein n=1 Tax=Megaselia scalaris TaxID=36166 RepID=T1GMA9_MEGSC
MCEIPKSCRGRLCLSKIGLMREEQVWGAVGKLAELPCDLTPPIAQDSVKLLLWFKDTTGIPLYTTMHLPRGLPRPLPPATTAVLEVLKPPKTESQRHDEEYDRAIKKPRKKPIERIYREIPEGTKRDIKRNSYP